MLDYPAIAALAEVIRRGSFEAAAAALHVTPSAVSQRVRSLEERMGAALVRRGPPASGTEAGLRLVRHLDQVRLLERGLDPDPSPAILRIAVNADSLATWFLPALAGTELIYDIVIDDQDHAQDWLRRGEVTAAITSGAGPAPGCDVIPLGKMRYVATASPSFAARWFPRGPTTEALAAAPAVTFNQKDRLQRDWAAAQAGRQVSLTTHLIPATEAFARAVRLGLGWGVNPEPLVRGEIGRRELIVLGEPMDVALDWQIQRVMAPRLAALTGAIRRRAAKALRN